MPPLPGLIAEALARGATVLTPNQRIAHTLRHAATTQVPAPDQTLTTPQIIPLDSWLTHLWHRLTLTGQTTRTLLNPSQQHRLWRTILQADPELLNLRSPDALADLATRAWRDLHLYEAFPTLRRQANTPDTRAFARWSSAFTQHLTRHSLITPAELPAALTAAALSLPTGLLLIDFAQLPPAHQHFLDHLDIPIQHHQTAVANPQIHSCTTPDEPTELQSCAHWSRRILEQNPTARIAIVVPDLATRRTAITRIFTQILAPELDQLPTPDPTQTGPFEFSLGVPLADVPSIAIALDILRLTLDPQSIETLSALLLSPFFGAAGPATDPIALAEFDAFHLRPLPLLIPELSLAELLHQITVSRQSPRLYNLTQRLTHAVALTKELEPAQPQPHATWADHFRTLLQAFGWSSTAALSSLTFQSQRRFDSALDELSTLDLDGSRISARAALAELTRITRTAVFAPETRQAPIQILGPLEPGGLSFDALWFLSAGDRTWPPIASPNPLIPRSLARTLNLPGADPQQDTTRAQLLTERLAALAPTTVFSYATQLDRDHQTLSSTLQDLRLTPLDLPALPKPPEPLTLELFEDKEPLPELNPEIIHGGAGILTDQSACAFRAFAGHRLLATSPETRTFGLDPRERGTLLHLILEHFYRRTPTQQALKLLTTQDLTTLLDEALAQSLPRLPQPTSPWDQAYLALERDRLHSLLAPWFEQEKARPVPFTVSDQETRLTTHLGPLHLSLRIDRIDSTALGPVLLDYKSGLAAPAQWLTPRPEAPQLPLYAVLLEEPPAAVAFAVLRPGQPNLLTGFSGDPNLLPHTPPMEAESFNDQLIQWHTHLLTLAESFAHHPPAVLPRDYPETCQFCSQRLLCRLNPALLTTEASDPDAADPDAAEAPGTEAFPEPAHA